VQQVQQVQQVEQVRRVERVQRLGVGAVPGGEAATIGHRGRRNGIRRWPTSPVIPR